MLQNQPTKGTFALHPNISMNILHTIPNTFLKVLTRRIFLAIKESISWWSFPVFLLTQCVIQGGVWLGEIRYESLFGIKELTNHLQKESFKVTFESQTIHWYYKSSYL